MIAKNVLRQPLKAEVSRANLMKICAFPLTSIFAFILGIAAPVTPAISEESKTAELVQVEILGGAFGLFDTTDGQMKLSPGNVVPLAEGQAYGWILGVRTSQKQVRWREEFTLPKAPASWGEAEPIGTRKLSDDSRVSTTERTVEPVNGLLLNSWAVAKGDPPGKYKIRVFVEGRLAATFDFEVR